MADDDKNKEGDHENDRVDDNSDGGSDNDKDTDNVADGNDRDGDSPDGDSSGDDKDKGEGKETSKQDKEGEDKGKDPQKKNIELKLSENSLLNDEDIEDMTGLATELGLSQDQAQKLIEREEAISKEIEKIQKEDLEKQLKEWTKTAKEDPEIGGKKFDESRENAYQALKEFGNKEVEDLLNKTKIGSHPEVLRLLSKVGAMVRDDSFVKPGKPANTDKKDLVKTWFNKN